MMTRGESSTRPRGRRKGDGVIVRGHTLRPQGRTRVAQGRAAQAVSAIAQSLGWEDAEGDGLMFKGVNGLKGMG